ncbi:MAG: threonine--tRNA ligase [Oligoflexales bacterium]|nr:threonine--tRNA ligase [Oligoflexales bacterium]
MNEAENPSLFRVRHSLAHILAQAVKLEFPKAQLGFGPATETGFFYDFDLGEAVIHPENLKNIEKKMKKIIGQAQEFKREDCDYSEAKSRLDAVYESYKLQNIDKLKMSGVTNFSFYSNGPFMDLCEGPHVGKTSEINANAFKLDRIAGAYWLGDEKNKMLTRIYGLAYETPEQLQDFLKRRELAEKYDHKKLGKELDLFHFEENIGKGLPLWLPNGTVIRDEIEKFAKEKEFQYGYQRVWTPHITKKELYEMSGHLAAYKDGMFPALVEVDELTGAKQEYYLKPMNCPHHHYIFKSRRRSYRDLPLRLAEYGTQYRWEQSGELSGIIRVRAMTINDAHIYCAFEDAKAEMRNVLKLYMEYYTAFKLTDYVFRLSLNDPENQQKYKGDAAMWEKASTVLREVLIEEKIPFVEAKGEAAFYGPKIDIQFKNLMGREETVSTIQLDLLSPQNFDLNFHDKDDKEVRPVIIHRSPLSTHERFISFLLEFYGGAMPTWCSPVQVALIPVNDSCLAYAEELRELLHKQFVRVEVDDTNNSFNKKIRNSAVKKIPISIIIGNKEVDEKLVTLRRLGVEQQETIARDTFVAQILTEIRERHNFREPMHSII